MLLLVVMLLLATLAPIKSVGAESTALVSDGVVNSTVLSSLYKAITGSNTATYSDVLAYAQTDRTCATLKTNNGGTAITVNFGGFEWLGVYLTTSRTGDAILDLYLKEARYGGNDNSHLSTYAIYIATDGASYPANMYGTSVIRAYINEGKNKEGTFMVASDNETLMTFEGVLGGCNFMFSETLNETYTKYITTPSEISYQETESCLRLTVNNNTELEEPLFDNSYLQYNEAYGTPSGGTWESGVDYSSKAQYSDWQYDYLWLPSVTEVGGTTIENAIWGLSEDELKCKYKYHLRTGLGGGSRGVLYEDKNGETQACAGLNMGFAIRPALHLNLTALNASTVANTGIATNILSVVTLGMSCTMFGLLLFFRKRTKRI